MPSSFKGGTPGSPDGIIFTGGLQLAGDANQDAVLDISDPLSLLLRLFGGLARPLPCDGATVEDGGNLAIFDVSGDGTVNVADAVHMLSFIFKAGAPPSRGTGCFRVEGCPSTPCR